MKRIKMTPSLLTIATATAAGTPDSYLGILFNGDQGIYKSAVIKELKRLKKNEGVKPLIKQIKTLSGDLEIGYCLIKAGQYDVLVSVYKPIDARTTVMDYIHSLYDEVSEEYRDWKASFEDEIRELVKARKPCGMVGAMKTIQIIDGAIDANTNVFLKKLEGVHKIEARSILDNFSAANERLIAELKKEKQNLEKEIEKLKRELGE